jgi:hypothetical protein
LKLYFDPEKKYEQKYLAMYNTITFLAGFSDVTIISWTSLIILWKLKFIISHAMFQSIPSSFQEMAHINILLLPRTAWDDAQILMFR